MYRTNAYVPEPVMKVRKIPTFIYVLGCASMVGAGGESADYLSRNLPEDHVSCAGFFAFVAFMIVAVYFAFRAAVALREE